jgi:hypothetical protein
MFAEQLDQLVRALVLDARPASFLLKGGGHHVQLAQHAPLHGVSVLDPVSKLGP